MSTTTKRVKKVFSGFSDLAHKWAQQTQEEGRCSNGFFEGDIIYSYGKHFPIARIYTNEKGERTVFFTTRTYSSTTAKHIRYTDNACSHMDMLYMSNPVLTDDIYSEYAYNWYHRGNIAEMVTELEELLLKFKRARNHKDWDLVRARNCATRITSYIKFFKIKKSLTKKAISLVEYARSADRNKEITAWEEKERIRLSDPKVLENRRKAQEARDKKFAKENAEQIEKWRNFEAYTPYISRKWSSRYGYGDRNTLLRYNEEKQRVETSKYIQVPVEIAHNFYRYIKIMIAKGGCKSTDCCNYKVLEYQVNEITDQQIKVGCHTIPMTEVETIATQLNWI